jgi:N-acyl-D-aspartate/D-glutamate deacylase
MHDLVIRGGTIVDGTGAPAFTGDVAIREGCIVEVGGKAGPGREEIDAAGLLITPGFVDLHTHYDGQAIWSSRINLSSSHGVTTVLLGNCGVGFAPCRPADRDLLCATMEGVEDIPGVVMEEGLTWDWETFPEYLDALERRPRDIDVATLIPHSAVRVYVMGERGAAREPATDADLAAMSELVREGIKAGALGFGTSRTPVDRRSDGELIPSFAAAERELVSAGLAIRDAGGGIFQMITELGMDGADVDDEFKLLRNVADRTGLPLTYTLLQAKIAPDRWHRMFELTLEANKTSAGSLHPQFFPRPVGMLASFDLTSNPFVDCPTYKSLAHLPLDQRIIELRKPEIREKIISEEPDEALLPLTALTRRFDWIYPLGDKPDYEPDPATCVVAQAERLGVRPEEVAYDLLLENDGRAMLLVAIANYGRQSLDFLTELFEADCAVVGLGDGGAHYGLICDSSYPTFVLAHWARDRKGKRLSLPQAVKAMTSAPAHLVGLRDRGILAPGYKADINIIDHARLQLCAPVITRDLPGGGRRLDQDARGYRMTIVAGQIIARDDAPTGVLPGRVVRGAQQPAAAPYLA